MVATLALAGVCYGREVVRVEIRRGPEAVKNREGYDKLRRGPTLTSPRQNAGHSWYIRLRARIPLPA